MAKSLKTLTRIQKFKIDEQRKILLEYQLKEDDLVSQLAKLAAELELERKFSSEQNDLTNFGVYVKRCIEKREQFEHHLNVIRAKIDEIQEVIADLFKEQKTYEIVDERRINEANKEMEAQDQKMLDEIGTNSYIKKHAY